MYENTSEYKTKHSRTNAYIHLTGLSNRHATFWLRLELSSSKNGWIRYELKAKLTHMWPGIQTGYKSTYKKLANTLPKWINTFWFGSFGLFCTLRNDFFAQFQHLDTLYRFIHLFFVYLFLLFVCIYSFQWDYLHLLLTLYVRQMFRLFRNVNSSMNGIKNTDSKNTASFCIAISQTHTFLV